MVVKKMKVVLTQDVTSLGRAGDVLEVRTGFARNFLFSRGLAEPFTEIIERTLKENEAHQARLAERRTNSAMKEKEILEKLVLTLHPKKNNQGTLFAAVSANEISEALKQRGVSILPQTVHFSEPIKTTGEYTVFIALTGGVTAKVRVRVE